MLSMHTFLSSGYIYCLKILLVNNFANKIREGVRGMAGNSKPQLDTIPSYFLRFNLQNK